MDNNIKTYNTASFRDKFMESGQESRDLLRQDFARFFIFRVEEMFRLFTLPVPPARVTTHTFIYLTEGEAIMSIGSDTYTIGKNECLIVPAGQVFSFAHADVNKGFICNFHDDFIPGKFLENEKLKDFEFLSIWGNSRIVPDELSSEYIHLLLKRLFLDYSEHGLQNLGLLQSYLSALLCEVQQVYKPVSSSLQLKSVAMTNRFKALLSANITTKHLVTDYAALLNITPNHLNKTIKQITGKSPSRWIDEALVLEAKVLLHQTGLSVNAVAAAVGILDSSYFSRLFKKYEGMTPLAFRKMIDKS